MIILNIQIFVHISAHYFCVVSRNRKEPVQPDQYSVHM